MLRRFPLMYLTCLFSIHLLTMVSRGSWPIGRKYRKSKIMFKPTKSKLSFFFVVLTFLPLIVMRLVVYPITFQTLKDEIIKNLEGAVRKQTELITKWMEERTADAQRIANNPLILLIMQSIGGSTEHTDLVKNMETIKYLDYLWKEYGSKEMFIADREGIVRIASRKELVGTDISAKDFFRSSMKGAFF